MTCAAIVVAAGAGARMGAGIPKALLPLAGRPLAAWCLDALRASPEVGPIVVVAPPGHERDVAMALGEAAAGADVVAGGASRAESVRAGLRAAPPGLERVLVHDAARPLLRAGLVAAVLEALGDADGAIAAAPVADTLKRAGEDLLIAATVDRGRLWGAQTPQAFRAGLLRAAVERAWEDGTLAAATDCASLVEAAGGRVRLVPVAGPNPKVTTPADVPVVEALLGDAGAGPARPRC